MVRALLCFAAVVSGAASAQTPANQHYDLNVYPSLAPSGGLYDLNVAPAQNGPPGTVALTNTAPSQAYSFQDIVRNTHGYVSAGVATHNGHEFEGGVSIPIVPGKADLDLAASTGQWGVPGNVAGGKNAAVTYDSYSAGLHLHPTDNVEAYIGVSTVRLHAPAQAVLPFGVAGPGGFPP